MRLVVLLSLILVLAAFPDPASAHSGGTNADGCHTNRRTGDHHCHRPKGGRSQRSYCHVLDGERRCGYALTTCQDLQRQFGGRCERR